MRSRRQQPSSSWRSERGRASQRYAPARCKAQSDFSKRSRPPLHQPAPASASLIGRGAGEGIQVTNVMGKRGQIRDDARPTGTGAAVCQMAQDNVQPQLTGRDTLHYGRFRLQQVGTIQQDFSLIPFGYRPFTLQSFPNCMILTVFLYPVETPCKYAHDDMFHSYIISKSGFTQIVCRLFFLFRDQTPK